MAKAKKETKKTSTRQYAGEPHATQFARPWYAHTDRWEIRHRTEYLQEDEIEVIEPRRSDPCFGPQVSLTILKDGRFEIFVSSGDDDGRYTVRVTRDELVALAPRIADDITIPGTGRDLNDDEARFLKAAIKKVLSKPAGGA